MVKFLIYNQEHYYDKFSRSEPSKTCYERNVDIITNDVSMSALQKVDAQAKLLSKYNAREQFGDIAEVRGGRSRLSGLESESFILISVDLDMEEVKDYDGPLRNISQEVGRVGPVKYNRKYSLDMTGIRVDRNNEASLSEIEFNNRLTLKTLRELR